MVGRCVAFRFEGDAGWCVGCVEKKYTSSAKGGYNYWVEYEVSLLGPCLFLGIIAAWNRMGTRSRMR